MKQKLTYLCTLAALLTATACTHDDAPAPGGTTEGTASAAFHIQTRADGTGIGQGQHAWLYLAERLPQLPDNEKLYCDKRYNVGNGAYLIENLTAQWYKMAFICLPEGVEAPEVDTEHEFNDYVIDYSPVVEQGEGQDARNPDKDLAIYRQIIDRWLLPDKTLKEDVTLTRITGQLVLDMGILKDQFPDKVTQISVTLTGIPKKFYLRDKGNGEIIPTEDAISNDEISYNFPIKDEDWNSNDHFRLYFDLPPFTLQSQKITNTDGTTKEVTGCKVTVIHKDETDPNGEAVIKFPLFSGKHGSDDKTAQIEIKANIRTTVYFRGMEDNEFEVRYAGFDNLSIDVDGDDWNGWN